MTATCPVCTALQPDGLMCHACTTRLEQALGDVRWIVTELDTTLSRQAKIGTPGKGGLAREKNPIHEGARLAGDYLANTLTTWARDVAPEKVARRGHWASPAFAASWVLLEDIDTIRRHPAVVELVDEIVEAIEQARRAVDRPADRMYLGQCATVFPGPDDVDVECFAELWGRPDATEVSCRVCGYEHQVFERRKWLIGKAAEMVVTAKEASRYLSDVGALDVSEGSIRNWVGRGKVRLRPGLSTQRQFELGALMDYIAKKDADAQEVVLAEMPLAV